VDILGNNTTKASSLLRVGRHQEGMERLQDHRRTNMDLLRLSCHLLAHHLWGDLQAGDLLQGLPQVKEAGPAKMRIPTPQDPMHRLVSDSQLHRHEYTHQDQLGLLTHPQRKLNVTVLSLRTTATQSNPSSSTRSAMVAGRRFAYVNAYDRYI
jgi:hypothetical protein